MTTLPTGAQFTAAANVSEMQGLVSDQAAAISEMPGGAIATTLTIAAGAVTPTVACHLVDTEGAAASDDLTNIITTNHSDGRRLLISMVDAARIVTIKHNAGGAGQIALANSYDLVLRFGGWVELKRTGANWEEVLRSFNLQNININSRGSSPSAISSTDSGHLIDYTGTGDTLALTAAATLGTGFYCTVRHSGSGNLVLDPNSTELIDGASTVTLTAGQSVTILCTGTAWKIIASKGYGSSGNMTNTGASTAGHVPKYSDTTGMALADGYAVASGATSLAALDAVGAFSKAQRGSPYALTDASTVALDASLGNNFEVQLAGNRTLGVPTNFGPGQSGSIQVYQDTTGSRTLAYSWCYGFAGGTAPTLTTTALGRDKLSYDVIRAQSAAVTMTIATPGVVTWTAHDLKTGDWLQLTTTGALPTGLTASTSYWVSVVDANSFKLSTTKANAAAGTYIATSGSQSGTHTATCINIDIAPAKDFR